MLKQKTINALTILFQVAIAFVATFFIYIIFALLQEDKFGFPFLVIMPIMAFVISLLIVIACAIIGLPIRLVPVIKRWWIRRPIIVFVGATIGVILLVLSYFPDFKENVNIVIKNVNKTKQIPNQDMVLAGWFLTTFSLLHFYPENMLRWISKKINSLNVNSK